MREREIEKNEETQVRKACLLRLLPEVPFTCTTCSSPCSCKGLQHNCDVLVFNELTFETLAKRDMISLIDMALPRRIKLCYVNSSVERKEQLNNAQLNRTMIPANPSLCLCVCVRVLVCICVACCTHLKHVAVCVHS